MRNRNPRGDFNQYNLLLADGDSSDIGGLMQRNLDRRFALRAADAFYLERYHLTFFSFPKHFLYLGCFLVSLPV